MSTNKDLEERLKKAEEEMAYIQRDMLQLWSILENLHPEVHTHYTMIVHTKPIDNCEDCRDG